METALCTTAHLKITNERVWNLKGWSKVWNKEGILQTSLGLLLDDFH